MRHHTNPALRRWLAPLGVILWLSWSGPASAQVPGTVLGKAQRAYDNRQYSKVIQLLRPALYPRSQLASEKEEILAYTLLGKAYWWRGQLSGKPELVKRNQRRAEQQFSALLSLEPDAKLSRLIHPKPLVDFFEKVRKKLTTRTSPMKALETELKHCRRTLTVEQGQFKAYRKTCSSRVQITRSVQKRYYFWNFVPFGVGQFQNGQIIKGSLFAAFQGAALLTSVTLYVLGESPYVRSDWGQKLKVNPLTKETDVQAKRRARHIQNAQITAGTLFWSLVAWGIIDAIVYFKKTKITQKRKLIPIGDPNVDLTPSFSGDRFTLGLTYRF